MVSKVLYRPFEETDFDSIATILQDCWHTNENSEVYNFLEACDDLAHCLSVSTFSQVALVDDAPRGIVLARTGQPDPTWTQRWNEASRDFFTQMRTIDKDALARYEQFISLTGNIDKDLLRTSGIDGSSEITLLAVDHNTQGLGIGSVLLDAAADHIASQGYTQTFLYTDTDCDWKFYERRGLRRAVAHRATRDERKFVPREMYLYRLRLSD